MVGLISTIVSVVIVAVFAGLNLDNRCDINIGFYLFNQVPVYLTIIASFLIGIVFTVPFVLFFCTKRRGGQDTPKKARGSNKKQKDDKPAEILENKSKGDPISSDYNSKGE